MDVSGNQSNRNDIVMPPYVVSSINEALEESMVRIGNVDESIRRNPGLTHVYVVYVVTHHRNLRW